MKQSWKGNSKKKVKRKLSIGVFAFNEEEDIVKVISRVTAEKGNNFVTDEIIIIADGCIDNTIPIVKRIQKLHKNIKLLSKKNRSGKPKAINRFFKKSRNKLNLIVNADNLPAKNSFTKMVKAISEKENVVLVGARSVCVNKGTKILDYCNRFVWGLHHEMARIKPKISGLVLVDKDVIDKIPIECAVDDAAMEAICQDKNKAMRYLPSARVYIRGPVTIKEYFLQRKRNHVGYIWIRNNYPNYKPSTFNMRKLPAKIVLLISKDPRNLIVLPLVAGIEVYSKLVAYYCFFVLKSNSVLWPKIHSSKGINDN